MNYATRYRSSVFETTILAIPTLAVVSALLLIVVYPAQAQTETILYDFQGPPDGANPWSSLTPDGAGNFYGTTYDGGLYNYGTVFELSPEPGGGCPTGSGTGSGWCETVLYSFTGLSDAYPMYSNVIFDSQGNLYGTTYGEGTCYPWCGNVFELSPAGPPWTESVLYSFCQQGGDCLDGALPTSGVIFDQQGNLFGTTSGGNSGQGTVFELSPSGSGWTEQVIYYPSGNNFNGPASGLTIDAAGNIFGVEQSKVFKLSPNGNGGWTPTVIHTFPSSSKDGSSPEGTPVLDSNGNLYGTTTLGGSKNDGTVWKLIPITTGKKKGTWKETILHSFTGGTMGYDPVAGVTLDSAGNIYGTTAEGGEYENGVAAGDGTVFELAVSGSTYKWKNLWSFNHVDGLAPYGSLIIYGGNLYGTTSQGGPTGDAYGDVFEINLSGTASTTTTVLTSSPNPSTSGEAVTFTAVVTPAPFDGETITFEHGKTTLGTGTLTGGSASFTTSTLAVGTTTVKAVYGGDGDFDASTSNTVKQVVKE